MVCRYCENEICVNDQCPLYVDYCPVPDIEGVCKFEEREDEQWMLTPKGCFTAALLAKADRCDMLRLTEETLDFVWEDFVKLMQRNGYIQETGDV